MFEFHYQHGHARRKLFQVQGTQCTIGSARGNDLVIDTRRVAKRHAQIHLENDGIYLSDLGSAGGCRVNGERILNHGPLSSLDEIEVGQVRIMLRRVERAAVVEGVGESDATMAEEAAFVAEDMSYIKPEITDSSDELIAYWARVVHEQLLTQMDLQRKDVNRMSDEQLRSESSQIIDEVIASLQSQLPAELDLSLLHQNVLNEAVGLGPLELFLADESVTEIMVNCHDEIFIEQAGKLTRSALQFSSDAMVYAVIERIITPLGRRIDESSPIVDARLKDGSRVNAVIPPLALKGPSLTIRKFPKHRMRFGDLVRSETLSQDMVSFLQVCVERRKNIIVSGGTGSGKTTLLNVLSSFIPDTDRVVTIEDAAELSLGQPNLVTLESRPAGLDNKGAIPIRDLVKNSLRMRPDRIVVGECRGGEALDMLQAMNTGHDGSLTTIHANTPRDVLSRLEVLVLMAGMDLPINAIREQVSAAVDIIIQQQRFTCGSRKITRITEVVGMESGTVQLQDIYRYEQAGVDDNHRVQGSLRLLLVRVCWSGLQA